MTTCNLQAIKARKQVTSCENAHSTSCVLQTADTQLTVHEHSMQKHTETDLLYLDWVKCSKIRQERQEVFLHVFLNQALLQQLVSLLTYFLLGLIHHIH